MTILLLRTALMRGRRQIRGSRTTRVDRRRTRITDGMMGLRHRIKVGPMITRRHRHRRIGTKTETVTETQTGIVIAIMIVTGMANHITMCTQHQELL
jgi:hypothetical protein